MFRKHIHMCTIREMLLCGVGHAIGAYGFTVFKTLEIVTLSKRNQY